MLAVLFPELRRGETRPEARWHSEREYPIWGGWSLVLVLQREPDPGARIC